MIVFELTMPHRGSWNNKWSGDGDRFIRVKHEADVPKEVWDREFTYRWDDGWEACVTVTRMPADVARKLKKKSAGFSSYDWMIRSIINKGFIEPERKTGTGG